MDCFGDMRLIGKSGTDIEVGKCTWLIVVALQRTNARQRAILEVSSVRYLFVLFRYIHKNVTETHTCVRIIAGDYAFISDVDENLGNL